MEAVSSPINFDVLDKGDEISTEQIEEFGGCTRLQEKAFQLAALKLRNVILDECRDRGRFVTVVITKGRIRILTDEEAARYNPRQFKLGLRRSRRSLRRLTDVNQVRFTDQQKRDHERNLINCGRIIQAVNSARATIVPEPYKRTTPGLPLATR